MRQAFKLISLALILLFMGCAGKPVPDIAYYRMPSVAAGSIAKEKRFSIPIIVDSLIANGVYNEQAILYVMKPGGSIKAYHYQLWDEPPGQLLQRRLVDTLRTKNASQLVTDRLPSSIDSLRISGRIERFERVKTKAGWIASVRLELRVERGAQNAPLIVSNYDAQVPAAGDTMQDTVRAFAAAIDQTLDALWSDLERLQG